MVKTSLQQPNVVFFCVDEMRGDHLGCAGNTIVKTPNLDRIAARGTLFRRGYCNNPICMPARHSIFTGRLPRDHGVVVNGQEPRRDLPYLAEILRSSGYRTQAAGKLHLTPWVPKVEPPEPERFPEDLEAWKSGAIEEFPTPYFGFTEVAFVGGHTGYAYGAYSSWLRKQGIDASLLTAKRSLSPLAEESGCYEMAMPEEYHYNRYIADATIKLVRESSRDGSKPFFAWCSFPDPHLPIAPPRPWSRMYKAEDMPLPARREGELAELPPVYKQILAGEIRPNGVDNRDIKDAYFQEILAGTYGMISHLDNEVGRVLDALEESRQMENTLIVFLADHGDMMGDHGLLWKAFYTFKGCINIPYIVAAPGCLRGVESSKLVSQIDILPTVLDVCGIPLPGSGWRKKETPFERGSVRNLQLYPGHSVLPLCRGEESSWDDKVVIENDDPTTGYQVRTLVTDTWRLSIYPGSVDGELFNLADDPDELHNLYYRPEYQADVLRLKAELLDAYACATPLYPVPPWNS